MLHNLCIFHFLPIIIFSSVRGIAADDCKEDSVNVAENSDKYAENFVITECTASNGEKIKANMCFRQKCNCGERYVQNSIVGREWDCESGITNNTFAVSFGEAIEFR